MIWGPGKRILANVFSRSSTSSTRKLSFWKPCALVSFHGRYGLYLQKGRGSAGTDLVPRERDLISSMSALMLQSNKIPALPYKGCIQHRDRLVAPRDRRDSGTTVIET